jgi:hypothetical protein
MRSTFSLSLFLLGAAASGFAAVDDGLLSLVPEGSKIITSVDISQARNSQFGQYVLSRMNAQDQGFDQLIAQTGFDPRQDLQTFVFASPGPDNERTKPRFAILARGIFDRDRIGAAAKANGALVRPYEGIDLYMHGSKDRRTAFAFLDVGVAVMGDVASVRQIVANRGNPTTLDAVVRQSISNVGMNDAWFVSTMPGSYLANHLKGETSQPVPAQALTSVVQSSGGIHFGDLVQMSLDAVARSPEDAKALTDVVRFLGSLVQMNRQKAPAAGTFASAVDGMTVQAVGDTVHVSLSIPEKALEQLADAGGVGGHVRH